MYKYLIEAYKLENQGMGEDESYKLKFVHLGNVDQ
jgi:hypothetical protein